MTESEKLERKIAKTQRKLDRLKVDRAMIKMRELSDEFYEAARQAMKEMDNEPDQIPFRFEGYGAIKIPSKEGYDMIFEEYRYIRQTGVDSAPHHVIGKYIRK